MAPKGRNINANSTPSNVDADNMSVDQDSTGNPRPENLSATVANGLSFSHSVDRMATDQEELARYAALSSDIGQSEFEQFKAALRPGGSEKLPNGSMNSDTQNASPQHIFGSPPSQQVSVQQQVEKTRMAEPISSQASSNEETNEVVFSRIREYPADFEGRFIVFIREWKVRLPQVSISRHLCNTYKTSIVNVETVHKQKMRVETTNAFTANLIIRDIALKDFRVSIPADSVEVNGVISIDKSLKVNELVGYGAGMFSQPSLPRVNIIDAYRMRRNFAKSDGTTGQEESDMVRVTFEGTALPKSVVIYGLRVPVRLYNPKLMFCNNCQGFNHTAKYCTSSQKCAKCGGQHETATCQQNNRCLYCPDNAVHEKKDCPTVKKKAENLKNRVKSRSRQAYSSLLKSADIVHENPYNSLSDESDDDGEIGEGLSYAKVTAGQKRSRTNKPRKAKTEPPTKRALADGSGGPTPSTSKTIPPSKVTNPSPRNRKKPVESSAEEKEWISTVKANILETIVSFDLPPFWANLASKIISRILDSILPKIYPMFSFLLPSDSDGQH
jgi:hypothetical protein